MPNTYTTLQHTDSSLDLFNQLATQHSGKHTSVQHSFDRTFPHTPFVSPRLKTPAGKHRPIISVFSFKRLSKDRKTLTTADTLLH